MTRTVEADWTMTRRG